jgi:hypothetical protein
MGKKHGHGKRIVRLDKETRREISGGGGEKTGPKNKKGQAQMSVPSSNRNVHLAAMLQLTQAGPKKIGSLSDRQKSM